MKTGKFRKVEFTIRPTSSYGRYEIEAIYRGKKIKTYTNCSETYDFVDDDSNKEKWIDARKSCYVLIRLEYARENGIIW